MPSRKSFLKTLAMGGMLPFSTWSFNHSKKKAGKPVIISTWKHGLPANEAAWKQLSNQKSALDAVEAGVRITEANPDIQTVGYGGRPDRDGYVTLDACVMDHQLRCGSVAFLQHIMHPVSVARKVMEDTPHVMLVGEGALQFAVNSGFKKQDLLTKESKEAWEKWKQQSHYQPEINVENHDTIGMLALDEAGNLAGACTTSGTAWKMHGRVGDSPLIGDGLYVDGDVGGAAATGLGEEVIRTCGSHLVVENMRHGDTPELACKNAVKRIINKNESVEGKQVGFIALSKTGEWGGYSIQAGFNFAVQNASGNELIKSKSWIS